VQDPIRRCVRDGHRAALLFENWDELVIDGRQLAGLVDSVGAAVGQALAWIGDVSVFGARAGRVGAGIGAELGRRTGPAGAQRGQEDARRIAAAESNQRPVGRRRP